MGKSGKATRMQGVKQAKLEKNSREQDVERSPMPIKKVSKVTIGKNSHSKVASKGKSSKR